MRTNKNGVNKDQKDTVKKAVIVKVVVSKS